MRCKACGTVRNKRDEAAERLSCRACGTKFPVIEAKDTPEPIVLDDLEEPKPKPKKKSAAKKGAKK